KASGGDAIFVKTDVSKERDVAAMVRQTVATFGRLDFAFNNAGIEQMLTPLPDQTEETYDQIMDINVKGVWLSLKHEIPAMLKTGGAAIVNNSSIAGLIAVAMTPIYIASRHAVIGLTKSVALEYARQNIRVNAIAPGTIETRMFYEVAKDPQVREMFTSSTPVGRVGRPDEICQHRHLALFRRRLLRHRSDACRRWRLCGPVTTTITPTSSRTVIGRTDR